MKKVYNIIFLSLIVIFMYGCAGGDDAMTEETIEENAVKEENEVSGELIQDTVELVNENENKASYQVSLTEVYDILCPKEASTRRSDVKYGTEKHIKYYSETTGCERGANILLPVDYDENKEYPVLYFLHGIFGDENSMIKDGKNKIKEVSANLAADGMIEDIIIVFPNMYATGDTNLKPGFTGEQVAPYDNFINDLVNDLIPYIEANYSVKPGRENRALIGFSMGGRETLFIGTRRSDLFSCFGAISPAPGLVPTKDWAMQHEGQISEDELVIVNEEYQPKLLMICCGTKDSVVGTFPKSYHEIMTTNSVDHLWYEIPDADHDNNAINSGFYNFLIRWFYEE